jgi:hypothetical protein
MNQPTNISFHGIAELREVDGLPGLRLQRAPESVQRALDPKSTRMYAPAGAEVRFVSSGPEVEITLSCPTTACELIPFWGGFQGLDRYVIGNEPVTVRIEYPERLRQLRDRSAGASGFSPDVWRLTIRGVDKHGICHFHDIQGDGLHPPSPEELPPRTYLAYGTSIAEGHSPSAAHISYVAQTARRLGMDHINLGCAGSCYCEPEMADYIAERDDWDIATLEQASNMIGAGFTVEEFRVRAAYMIDRIAGANPRRPVACIVWYPYFADACVGIDGPHQVEIAEAYRAAYRDLVAQSPHPNVQLIEGADLLTAVDGYTIDLSHPGDAGMTEIADRLAPRLAVIMDGS